MTITQLKKAFLGQLWGSFTPQLMDIWLSTSRFLNMSLEKWFKYTSVSLENWLKLVIFGLFLLLGSTKCLICAYLTNQSSPEVTNGANWFAMTLFWGLSGSYGVILGENMNFFKQKAHFEAVMDQQLIFSWNMPPITT